MSRTGQWVKGQSGNPGGRPRHSEDVREAAKAHTAEAIRTLAEIMRTGNQPAAARVRAAECLLDRAWGTPLQTVQVSEHRSIHEYTDGELTAIIEAERAIRQAQQPA